MKRKLIYLSVFLTIFGLLFLNYQINKARKQSKGSLGDKIVYALDGNVSESAEKSEDEKQSAETAKINVEEEYPSITSDNPVKVYSDTGTAVIGDTGFEIYNYVESTAKQYAKIVNKLTKKLKNKVPVYSMLIPTSIGITLPDNKKEDVNSSDQKESLEKISQKFSANVNNIPLYSTMMRHRNEYIYYRTDHHWTALGAYYAYEAFCQNKQVGYASISEHESKASSGFLGSFYNDSHKNKNLKKDTLKVYYPLNAKLHMEYTNNQGKKGVGIVVIDPERLGTFSKYCAFLGGDHPYTVIRNKNIQNGSSCVVIKESFGNALVPYLTEQYQSVYVIDYRYWKGDIVDFIKKKKKPEVLFVNNISMTRNTYLVGQLAKLLSKK